MVAGDDRTKNFAVNGCDGMHSDYFPHEYKTVEVLPDKRFKCSSTEEQENVRLSYEVRLCFGLLYYLGFSSISSFIVSSFRKLCAC